MTAGPGTHSPTDPEKTTQARQTRANEWSNIPVTTHLAFQPGIFARPSDVAALDDDKIEQTLAAASRLRGHDGRLPSPMPRSSDAASLSHSERALAALAALSGRGDKPQSLIPR